MLGIEFMVYMIGFISDSMESHKQFIPDTNLPQNPDFQHTWKKNAIENIVGK